LAERQPQPVYRSRSDHTSQQRHRYSTMSSYGLTLLTLAQTLLRLIISG
jgi:hypothetical protein